MALLGGVVGYQRVECMGSGYRRRRGVGLAFGGGVVRLTKRGRI